MSTPLTFAVKPTLTGELVTLRPAQADDAGCIASLDAESNRLTGSHREFSAGELSEWYGSRSEQPDRLDWAVLDNASGAWAGEVVLNDLDPDNRACGLRIVLAGPAFYNRGLGTEATRLAVEYAFGVGVHRVELEVYEFNHRARRAYEKVGFRLEGTRRDALLWDGQRFDAHIMSILACDEADLPA